MPALWRRLFCRVFGHRLVVAGVGGLFEFEVCKRCGGMPYARGDR